MKWREPWMASLRQQKPFNPLQKSVFITALVLTGVLLVPFVLSGLGQDLGTQLDRARNLWIAPAVGGVLALLLYVVEWLSPRRFDSGPSGIVIVKADRLALIPWQAIEGYAITRTAGHNVLHLSSQGGESHRLVLAARVHPKEVEREIMQMTGKHPDDSPQPPPRGAA